LVLDPNKHQQARNALERDQVVRVRVREPMVKVGFVWTAPQLNKNAERCIFEVGLSIINQLLLEKECGIDGIKGN